MGVSATLEETYLRGLGRAAAGAVIFGFPLLMTMEMWEFGVTLDPLRLALFVTVIAAVVCGLSAFAGFRATRRVFDDMLDAFAALMVGFVVSAALLALFGIIEVGMPAREIVGKVAIQAAPASIGAILAGKQLHEGREAGASNDREDRAGYLGQLFLMTAGALFLAFNVAPTEEMILIAYKMSPWHGIGLVLVALAVLHGLVFAVGFAGQKGQEGHGRAFFEFTLAGYGIALLVGAYILWTFGRADGQGAAGFVRAMVVLSFPGALGAAAARLLV